MKYLEILFKLLVLLFSVALFHVLFCFLLITHVTENLFSDLDSLDKFFINISI